MFKLKNKMKPLLKKFSFIPRQHSPNKRNKSLHYISDNSSDLNVIKKNFNQNNLNNIGYEQKNTDNKHNNIDSKIKYLINENKKEDIDFINTFLKLKGLQNEQIKNKKINHSNIDNNPNNTEKNTKFNKDRFKDKKFKRDKLQKNTISKIYNNKIESSKKNRVKEITIDLMDLESKNVDKINSNKKRNIKKIQSYDNKKGRNSKEKDINININRTKTMKNSPFKKKIYDKNKTNNYKTEIENKKKQLLHGKLLNSHKQKKIKKFNIIHRNPQKYIHYEKSKKSNFHIIKELDEDKSDILNIKTLKDLKEDVKPKNVEKIAKYINIDEDYNQEENERYAITETKNNNNSIITNETLINDTYTINKINSNRELSSFISSSTFNNDLVNYKPTTKNSHLLNNNLNNINNHSNTNFTIESNSVLKNKDEEKLNFIIENNSNMILKDIDQNSNVLDSILTDNKEQIQQKINIYDNNNSELDSQDKESIIEKIIDINNIQIQNESKEIKLSQININKNKKEEESKDININSNPIENNISKSSINITNLSKFTNFTDSKFLDINYCNNIKNNKTDNPKNLPNKTEENNIKRIEHKKFSKIQKNINIRNENKKIYPATKKEKVPEDRIIKDGPRDNYSKKTKNIKSMNEPKNNIFDEDDISPSKKLVNLEKRKVLYLKTLNDFNQDNDQKIITKNVIFNNQMYIKNESKVKTLKVYKLLDFDDANNCIYKQINNKKYNYTSISPYPKNISIKNNINNNIIINYKD